MSVKEGRLTKDVLASSIENALRAGYEAGWRKRDSLEGEGDLDAVLGEFMDSVDLDSFDSRPSKAAPAGKGGKGKPEKKKSPKKPKPGPDLAELPYNVACCRARWYNKGYGAQCWKVPTDESGDLKICEDCLDRYNDDGRDFWGMYDEPIEDAPMNSKGKPHAWKVLAEARAAKKESDKALKAEEAARKKAEKAAAAEKKKAEKAAEAEKKKMEKEEAAAEKKKLKKELKVKAKKQKEEEEEADGSDEDTQELEEDTEEIAEPAAAKFEEYTHDGYKMKWNKETNELLDPDDDEVLGKITFDDDGNPVAVIDTEDDSDEEP